MISVYTPIHPIGLPYLNDAYASLVSQTHTDWEWILVPNCGVEIPPAIASDERVRVHEFDVTTPGGELVNGHHRLGAIKKYAVERCRGDVYVELDGDDMLTPDCLQRVHQEMADGARFVYSNSAEFFHGTWKPHVFGEYYGWRKRPFKWGDHDLIQMVAFPPTPHAWRLIMWAPNHVRAWHRDAYWRAGGYDPQMVLGADHTLCVQTYLRNDVRTLRHIDECLYLYRCHGENSCVKYNKDVQHRTWSNYHQCIMPMAQRWAESEGYRMVDLGGGIDPAQGLEAVDIAGGEVQADLNRRWPFDDDSVGVARASHVFEHLADPLHTMRELFRVMAPGGFAFIDVPSTDGRGAFQDPTHRSFWNENSFSYYTDRAYARYLPEGPPVRFQKLYCSTYTPKWGEEIDVKVTRCHLACLKPPYSERWAGEKKI